MTGKTHMICSATFMAVYATAHVSGAKVFGTEVLPVVSAVASVIGALLPDIDIPQSKLGNKFKFISSKLSHRGITHTLLMPLILLIASLCVTNNLANLGIAIVVSVILSMVFDSPIRLTPKTLLFIVGMICNPLFIQNDVIVTLIAAVLIYVNSKSIIKSVAYPLIMWVAPDVLSKCVIAGALSFTAIPDFKIPMTGAVTLMLMVLCNVVLGSIGSSLLFGLCAGWILHIIQDLFNKKGCPIFYPFTKKKFHIATIKTRHWSETLFLVLWEGGCLLWLFLITVGH